MTATPMLNLDDERSPSLELSFENWLDANDAGAPYTLLDPVQELSSRDALISLDPQSLNSLLCATSPSCTDSSGRSPSRRSQGKHQGDSGVDSPSNPASSRPMNSRNEKYQSRHISKKYTPIEDPRKRRTAPLPHNQVERKYRMRLTAELNRLRQAIPTIRESELSAHDDEAKLSKAAVLAAAVDYIASVNDERERLKERISWLKQDG